MVFAAGLLVVVLIEDVIQPRLDHTASGLLWRLADPVLLALAAGLALYLMVLRPLRSQQAKFKSILDTLSEGVALNEVVLNAKGEMVDYRILEVNAAFYTTADFVQGDVVGQLATKLYGMDVETIGTFWRAHKGSSKEMKSEVVSPISGKCFSVSTSPIFDGKFVTSFSDITERKQQEEDSRQLAMEMEIILRNALVGIVHLRKRTIVSCNRRLEEIFGYEKGELVGQTTERLYASHEIFVGVGERAYADLANNNSYNEELMLRKKDGSLFSGALTGCAIDPACPHDGSIWIYADISERRKAELALKESRERFDLAVRGSSDGIWDWNIETGETYVSDRWWEMLGYRPGEISFGPKGWSSWIHPDDRVLAISQLREHLKTRKPYSSEYRMTLKNGEYRWFLNRGQAIWNAEGRAVRIAGSTSEITERKKSDERLHAFLENSAVIAWMKDAEGRYVFVSDNFLKRFGFSSEEVMGKSDEEVWPSATAAQIQGRDAEVLGTGKNIEMVELVTEADGRRSWWLKHKFLFSSSAGGRYVGGLGVDITEGKIAEEQLRKLSLAVEQSPESVVITNLDAEIEYVNEAFVQKTGYSRAEVMGKNPRILHSDKTPPETFAAMWKAMAQGQPWKGDFHNRRKDGSDYIEHAIVTPIRQPDGTVTHYVAVKEDITSRKASEDQINTLAFYDPLTNLPNRRLLLDRLKQALASSARNKRYGALLFIDLDNFKTLNDTLGHDIGDLLLLQVAQRLTTCVRVGDTVARLGGDEFVVMLEDLSEHVEESAAQTKTVGEKILSTLNQSYQLAIYSHHSTPSIGVTLFSDQQETIDELLKRADLAMYQAKAAGRNTLRFFDPEMQAVVTARAALEADLREAVLKDQFLLHYQAQVVGEGRVTGVEVLLRWQHPQRGMVSPGDFIPLAEDTGLILSIGHWVLQTACGQLAVWAGRPEMAHLTIAVNVSARQFHHEDFVDQVQATLDQTGANPQRLKLELTESLLVDDVESVIAKMSALKMRGVGFSMDDFGTGYSSLSYLKRLPLDQLKIDQGFVRDILTDANDAAIAKMVVVLAESLGLSVIAEGVEIEAQRDFLARHGCHAYQGYLFSRPLPLVQFEEFALKI